MFLLLLLLRRLVAFVVVLALSNLGTSIGGATLAKDTSMEGNGHLVDKHSHKVVAVQSASEQYSLFTTSSNIIAEEGTEGTQGASDRTRRESACTKSADSLGTLCSSSTFSLIPSDAHDMIESCKSGRVVVLTRNFSRNRSMQLPICPVASGYRASYSDGSDDKDKDPNPTATLGTPKGNINIKPDSSLVNDGNYVVEGDGITSDEGEYCDTDGDCDDGLDSR